MVTGGREMPKLRKPAPIGQKFGMLTILEDANDIASSRAVMCKCDCGNTKIIRLSNIVLGGTRSCSCQTQKFIRQRQKELRKLFLMQEKQKEPKSLLRRIKMIELRLLTNTLPENKRVMYRIKMDKLTDRLLSTI